MDEYSPSESQRPQQPPSPLMQPAKIPTQYSSPQLGQIRNKSGTYDRLKTAETSASLPPLDPVNSKSAPPPSWPEVVNQPRTPPLDPKDPVSPTALVAPAAAAAAAVPTGETRLQVALDYGTTFTGVAYLSIPAARQQESDLEALVGDIRVVQSWPPNQESNKVPSQHSYSNTPKGCKQWGYDIDDNSLVLKRTKIQLEEVRSRLSDLRTLSEMLYQLRLLDLSRAAVKKSGVPKHLAKEPEDIVKDYLDYIAERTLDEIKTRVGRNVPAKIPIDLVVTHPAEWSNRALNSTFRAVRGAFNEDRFPQLRNISFVPEPVACAHYTLREAWRQDSEESEDGLRFRKNDAFVVVDAGGGTVDLASFKVLSIDQDKKQIRFEQVGNPTGDTCGATCIDKQFERFVEERLGREDWKKLIEADVRDHGTGGHSIVKPRLRRIQEKFQPIKHQFDGSDSQLAWPIQLPRDIGSVEDEARGLSNGALKITADDLKLMFEDSVDRTLYLIEKAVNLLEIGEGLTVRNIFLSGGFAQSKYLYNKVRDFGKQRKIDVKRGEDCWIAVAKGAIIKSLGIYTKRPLFVNSCPRHYGIKVRKQFASYENHPREDVLVDADGVKWARDQIRWFIRKGDGVFPGKPTVATYECSFTMKTSEYLQAKKRRASQGAAGSSGATQEVILIASRRDRPPMRVDDIDKEQEQSFSLTCDLTEVSEDYIEDTVDKCKKFNVTVVIEVQDKVKFRVKSGKKELVSLQIPL